MLISCLTIYAPYAQLTMTGRKPCENRHWPAPEKLIGRRLGIHLGQRFEVVPELQAAAAPFILRPWAAVPDDERGGRHCLVRPEYRAPEGCGRLLGTVRVEACFRPGQPDLGFSGLAEHEFRRWWLPGCFGWQLSDPRWFPEAIEVKGRQGLWNYAVPDEWVEAA